MLLKLHRAGAIGLLVLSVPLAWVLGFLRMPMLYVVSVAIGAVYTVAGSASQIVLTQLVGRENLVRAHAQNAIASSAAEVLGPGLAGLLIKVWGAPLALLMNSILLIGSVTMLKGIRINEKRPPPSAIPFWKEMKLGLDFVHQTRLLKEIAWTMGGWHFFAKMALSIQIIFAINDLALEQNVVSLSYVAIGLGSILGGFMGPRFSKYIGPGPGLLTGIAITSVGWLIASCLQNWLSHMVLFSSMLFSYSFGATFMFINFLSIRQGITPSHMLGRMTATMRWYSLLPAGPGALLGGWTAEHYGMTWAIGLAGIGTLSVALIATWRPYLRVLRTLPQPYVAISEN